MRRIVGMVLLAGLWLSLFAQVDKVQRDIQKRFGVPPPKLLFSINHRISVGEWGLSTPKLFLISQDNNYFYISITPLFYDTSCYDRNGRLISRFQPLSDEEMYKETLSKDQSEFQESQFTFVRLFDDNKIVFLIYQYKRTGKKSEGNEYDGFLYEEEDSYKFLVFTPYGKIDEKSTTKLNHMIEKLNNDIQSNKKLEEFLGRLIGKPNAMIINNKNDSIDFIANNGNILRITHDGNYTIISAPSIVEEHLGFMTIDPQGNIRLMSIHDKEEKREEITIKTLKRDKGYKDIDEIKIKIDETITRHIGKKASPRQFTVDARGHIFLIFSIDESQQKNEWQVEYYPNEENIVAKYPGYIIYEFDPAGKPIGPRALLQTIYDLVAKIALDDELLLDPPTRFTLDNQGNLYYLHFRPDSTQVWMVPSSRTAK